MSSNEPFDRDEAFALAAYSKLPKSQPSAPVEARIRKAAHAINASRRPRLWTTGLATAAVAVLAVGVAWRGRENQPPEFAPGPTPQTAPTMQPAFNLESVEPATEKLGASRDDSRERANAPQTPPTPALETAEWETPTARPSSPARATQPDARPEVRAAPATAPLFDEPLPMAEPAPAPPALRSPPVPPAPLHRDTLAGAVSPKTERSNNPIEPLPKPDRPGRISEPPPAAEAAQDIFAEALKKPKPGDVKSDRQQLDAGPVSRSSSIPSDAGSAPPSTARPTADIAEQAGSQVRESVRRDPLPQVVSASAYSVREGTTSLGDAIAAARAARARGDSLTARELSAAIASRFGRQRLPNDLREIP